MKKSLSEIEVKQKIVKYLNKKGIPIILTETEYLVWFYKIHYSEFAIRLQFEKRKWEDRQNNIIRYSVGEYVKGIGRRRTSITSDGFCLAIYNNLIYIKEELNKIAENIRDQRDTKTKYCTELEMYYKRVHASASVSINKSYDGALNINVSGYDKGGKSTFYSISYIDNRYYLNSKSQSLNEEIPL